MISHEIPTANGDLQDFLKTVSVNIYDVCVCIYMFSRVDSRELRSNAGKIFFFEKSESRWVKRIFSFKKPCYTEQSQQPRLSD